MTRQGESVSCCDFVRAHQTDGGYWREAVCCLSTVCSTAAGSLGRSCVGLKSELLSAGRRVSPRSPVIPEFPDSQRFPAASKSQVSEMSAVSQIPSGLFSRSPDFQMSKENVKATVCHRPRHSKRTCQSSPFRSNSPLVSSNFPGIQNSPKSHVFPFNSAFPKTATCEAISSLPMPCKKFLGCRTLPTADSNVPALQGTTAAGSSSVSSRSIVNRRITVCLKSPLIYLKLLIFLIFLALLNVSAVAADAGEREPVLQCYIVEELPPGTPTGCTIVTDYGLDRKFNASVLSQLRFSFLVQPPPDRNLFSIDEEGGTIRTTRRIDREEVCPRMEECCVKFDVAVRPIQFLLIIKVRVEILDINDHSPRFDLSSAVTGVGGGVSFDLSESSDPGTGFPLPSADDLDQPRNGVHHYEIVPPSDVFELSLRPRPDGSSNIRLLLKTRVDRETTNFYQFKIVAFDGGETSRTAILPVNVTILDANDNAPEFDNSTYEVRLREDVAPGTAIVQVRAVDGDLGPNGIVTYNFTADTIRSYGPTFGIDPDRGTIFTKGALDYETQAVYVLYVTANDRAEGVQLTSQALVVIRLDDINDNDPSIRVNALAQSSDHGQRVRHQPEVVEGSDVGAFVAHVTVEDKDSGANGKFHCYILDSNLFELRQMYPTEFKVVTLVRFDREVRDEYAFSITCRDGGIPSRTSNLRIEVKVTDRNDHSPVFLQEPYLVFVDENNPIGVNIARVAASDRDSGLNGQITYTLDAGSRHTFDIDPKTGVISTKISFDYENATSHEISVFASDAGSPPRSSDVIVQVRVRDLDDEIPVFQQAQYTFIVEENQLPGTQVGTVTAVDRDTHPLNRIFYFLDHVDTTFRLFQIDSTSGLITLLESLDREEQASYELLVGATPLDAQPFSTVTASVKVYVSDLNDNKPVLEFPNRDNDLVFVSSQSPPGYIIARVKAHDVDTGLNARLHFRLTNGNDEGYFHIETETGDVVVNRDLTSADVTEFILEITVTDSGDQSLSDHASLVVRIRQGGGILFPRSDQMYALLASEDLAIVLVIALATILLAIAIIVAIICLARKRSHRKKGGSGNESDDEKKYNDSKPDVENEKDFRRAATIVCRATPGGGVATTLMDDESALPDIDFEHQPLKPEAKPVVAFIKDPSVKKVSPNSDSSASDSGRGHSSEEGDTLRRTPQPPNRDYDFSPTFTKPECSASVAATAAAASPSLSSSAAAIDDRALRGIDAKANSIATMALIESGYSSSSRQQPHHSSSICSASESDSASHLDRQPPHSSILLSQLHLDPHLSCSHLSLLLAEASKDDRLCSTLVASVPHPWVSRAPQRTPIAFTLDGRGRRERSQSGPWVSNGVCRTLQGVRRGERAPPLIPNHHLHHTRQESQLSQQYSRRPAASQSSSSLSDGQPITDGTAAALRLTTASSMLDCQNGNDWPTRCHDDDCRDDGCYGDRLPARSSPKLPTVYNGAT